MDETSSLLRRRPPRSAFNVMLIGFGTISLAAITTVIVVVTSGSNQVQTVTPHVIPATTTDSPVTAGPSTVLPTSTPPPATTSTPHTTVVNTTAMPVIEAFLEQYAVFLDPICGASQEVCSKIPSGPNGRWAIHHNGLCWAWVGSCNNCAMNFTAVTIPTWHAVSSAEIWALRPDKSQFYIGNPKPVCGPSVVAAQRFTAGCASSVLTPNNMHHCDYCDAVSSGSYSTVPLQLITGTADVWLVCGETGRNNAVAVARQPVPSPLYCTRSAEPTVINGTVHCTYSAPNAENKWIESATCSVTCNSTSVLLDASGVKNDVNITCSTGQWQTVSLPTCRFNGCIESAVENSDGRSHMTPVGEAADASQDSCLSGTIDPVGGGATCLANFTWSYNISDLRCLQAGGSSCRQYTTCATCTPLGGCAWCDSLQRCVPGLVSGPTLYPGDCPLGDLFTTRCWTVVNDSYPAQEFSSNIAVIDQMAATAAGGDVATFVTEVVGRGCINCEQPTRCYYHIHTAECGALGSPVTNASCQGIWDRFPNHPVPGPTACLCDRFHQFDGSHTCEQINCHQFTGQHSSTCSNEKLCSIDEADSGPFPKAQCNCDASTFGQDCGLAADETSSYNSLLNP